MTREELTAEVVAEVRDILAKFREWTSPPMLTQYTPGGLPPVGIAMHAADAGEPLTAEAGRVVAPMPGSPGLDEIRQRIRERETNPPPPVVAHGRILINGPVEITHGGQHIGTDEMPQEMTVSPGADILRGRVVREAFTHLLALLELSPGEREFVQAAADANIAGGPAEAYPLLEIFGDWLEDQGRIADAIRVRKASPACGDVLVLSHPYRLKAEVDQVQKEAKKLQQALKDRGRDVVVVGSPVGGQIRFPDREDMRTAGWIRVADHKKQLDRLLYELDGKVETVATRAESEVMAEAVAMIRRLKRENAELRRRGKETSVEQARAFTIDRSL